MAKRTKAADLAKVIGKIVDGYGESVVNNVAEVTKRVARAGASELRGVSRDRFGQSDREKPYAAGWGATDTGTRLAPSATIWNKTNPGLVHLLENGHAIRRGGRTVGAARAHPHVVEVEEKLAETFEREVVDAIQRSQ